MERITKADLVQDLAILKRAAIAVGIPESRVERWNVQTGSKTYGNAYRLYQLGADYNNANETHSERFPFGSGHYSCAGMSDYLGMTTREAHDALRNRITALWAVPRKEL